VIDDLHVSYHEQMTDQASKLKSVVYKPQDHGKVDFYGKVNAPFSTFAHPSTFNTVFISGDDMVKEEAEMREAMKQAWKDKVVVKNPHFKVNTRVNKSH
jgi:hypothetical protein